MCMLITVFTACVSTTALIKPCALRLPSCVYTEKYAVTMYLLPCRTAPRHASSYIVVACTPESGSQAVTHHPAHPRSQTNV